MSASNAAATISVNQYLSFSLGAETFATPVSRVREIMDLTAVTRVPQTPAYMLGVINLRGSVVPVIDLRSLLGLPGVEQTRDSCIIVLEIALNGELFILGAVADAVREVFDLADDQIEPPPRLGTRLRTDFIQGLAHLDERLIICLNIERVLTADQLEVMQDVAAG